MNIIVLGGFLGAGKTTFLLKLAHYLAENSTYGGATKLAIIENEIGAVGIDSNILHSGGLQTRDLFAGCACCSLKEELIATIEEIQQELNPETIIIESTGVGIPENIRLMIQARLNLPVHVIVLVDGSRWFRILPVAGELARGQLAGADTVIINKIDLLSKEELDHAQSFLTKEVPGARVFACSATAAETETSLLPEICSAFSYGRQES